MNISTNMFQYLSTNAILDQQTKLNNTQLQIATGNRMLVASDDPAASARVLDLKETLSVNDQFKSNMDTLTSRGQMEDTTLTSIWGTLQTAHDLALQGMNDSTLSATQKQDIAGQITHLKNALSSLINTKNSSGEYIFSGTLSSTAPYPSAPPYTYQGDANQRKLQISGQTTVADGDPGSQIFGNMPSGAGSILDSLDTFATALSTPGALGTAGATVVNDLSTALDQASMVQANVAGRMNAVSVQSDVNVQFKLDTQKYLSDVNDVDITKAISDLTTQQLALQAAQQSFSKVQGLSLFNYMR